MRLGDTWTGSDGSKYDVVLPNHVRDDQPRWWLDIAPPDGDRVIGPHDPTRLHLFPARMFGAVEFALVAAAPRVS